MSSLRFSKIIGLICGLLATALFVACSNSVSQPTSTTTPSVPVAENKPVAESPGLDGLIKSVSLYPVPGRADDLAISLIVSIHNSGAPNRPEGWRLEVNAPKAGIPTGLEPVHVNGVVDLPGSNRTVDLAKEDLTVKAANAIGSSAQVEGVLTFVLPGTQERALSHNSSSLILHFTDAQGHAYQTPKAYIGKKVGQ